VSEARVGPTALARGDGFATAAATANRRHRLAHAALFVALLGALVWAYDYARVAKLGPISMHAWRQADGASLALNYYENGMRFFEPRVHNLLGGEGRAAAELPLLYYAVAALYQIFGPDDWLFRMLNFAILALGLFLFSRALLRFVADPWLALFPAFFLMGSPLLAFYAFNFLPNTAALGMILVAASLYTRFHETQRLGWFYAASATAALAALLKVSALIPFLALVLAALALPLLWPRDPMAGRVPRAPHLLAATVIVLGLCASWYLWAQHYNEVNASSLFLLDMRPLWALPAARIAAIVQVLFRDRRAFFDAVGLGLLAVLTVLPIVRTRHLPRLVALVFWLMLLGCVAFLVLFFGQLRAHDYYFIDVMPFAALVLALGVWTLDRGVGTGTARWAVRIGLVLVVLANVDWAQARMFRFYTSGTYRIPAVHESLNKREELARFLREHRIGRPDRALVLGDGTPNLSLYYLDLPGWTRPRKRIGPRALARFAAKGARHLVVLAPPWQTRRGESPFPTARPIAVFDGRIQFYDLTEASVADRASPTHPAE
jgi:hypothetical protein